MSEIWFPLYPERFLSSRKVRRMDAQEVGIYFGLLVEQFLEGGALPDDDEELGIAGRAPIEDVRRVLELCFTLTDDGWLNETMEQIRDQQAVKMERAQRAGKKGAEVRWKRKAKTPKPQVQEPQELDSNPIATPMRSQCYPNGIESKSKRESKRKTDEVAKATLSSSGSTDVGWQGELMQIQEEPEADPATWMHNAWERQFGTNGHPLKLTDDRRQKYRAMYREQLKDTPDPKTAWRAVLHAVSLSSHHTGNRAYLMPESLLLNANRRDRWVQQTMDTLSRGPPGPDRERARQVQELADYLKQRGNDDRPDRVQP